MGLMLFAFPQCTERRGAVLVDVPLPCTALHVPLFSSLATRQGMGCTHTHYLCTVVTLPRCRQDGRRAI